MPTGRDYEAATERWLQESGCTLVCRNYACRAGEIDLIFRSGDLLLFVEVRARSNPRYAGAAASVDWRKQARLRRTAAHFLQRAWREPPPPCRFDVVVWEPSTVSGKLRPRWIKNAFGDAA